MPKLTKETILSAQKKIIEILKMRTPDFVKIRESQESIAVRWQAFIGVVLPAQLEAIKDLGFAHDQSGLMEFNRQVTHESAEDRDLQKINCDKWAFLLAAAFGITQAPTIDLNTARALVTDIADAMTVNCFLEKVDDLKESFSKEASMLDKRQALLEVIVPVHMLIMQRYGFEGDLGYIKAQRALVDFYHDPVIKEQSIKAQQIVFARAGLL